MFRFLARFISRPDISSLSLAIFFSFLLFIIKDSWKLWISNFVISTIFFPFNLSVSEIREIFRAKSENKLLRLENVALNEENRILKERERIYGWESKILSAEQISKYNFLSLRVVSKDIGIACGTMVIRGGLRDGVKRNLAVVTPEGLVGKVIEAGERTAVVNTILSPSLHVGAMITRNRIAGILEWKKEKDLCLLTKISREEKVTLGDTIITSGLGDIFPNGIKIGIVTKIEDEPGGFFHRIEVRPFVKFSSLEGVVVLLGEKDKSD